MDDNQVEGSIEAYFSQFGGPLPEWAEWSTDKFEVGAQLRTRDGRRVGNGCIIGTEKDVFCVLTDMGSRIKLTMSELEELFYTPCYIMNVDEYISKVIFDDNH